MVTRVLLLQAGPTAWDRDGRICGSMSLPLTAEGIDSVRHTVERLPHPAASVYRPTANEACEQTARIIAQRFSLRARNSPELHELHLGLWQGLMPEEIRSRFPTAFRHWLENPLNVTPPDGEPLAEAIERIREGLERILKRNRGQTVAIAMRPMSMQIARGVLQGQTPPAIAQHLRETQPVATIEIEPRNFRAA